MCFGTSTHVQIMCCTTSFVKILIMNFLQQNFQKVCSWLKICPLCRKPILATQLTEQQLHSTTSNRDSLKVVSHDISINIKLRYFQEKRSVFSENHFDIISRKFRANVVFVAHKHIIPGMWIIRRNMSTCYSRNFKDRSIKFQKKKSTT